MLTWSVYILSGICLGSRTFSRRRVLTSFILAAIWVEGLISCSFSRAFQPFLRAISHSAKMSSPLSKPQIIAHIQKSLNYTVFDSKWIPCSAKFVCLGNFPRGTGVMQIYEVQRGEAQLIKEVHNTLLLFALVLAFSQKYIVQTVSGELAKLMFLEKSCKLLVSIATGNTSILHVLY